MDSLTLSAVQSFYIGGSTRVVPGHLFGEETQVTDAMYVQRMVPAQRGFPLPVVFVHGGMHTGATWETTPDGREGWQLLFLRSGFETVIIDQPWRGRSAPDLTGLNPFGGGDEQVGPAFTAGFRLAERFARGGGRFPFAHMHEYASQLWPDFGVPAALAAGVPGLSDPRSLPPLLKLLDRCGPVVLVTHSQGGDLGWKAALARPDKVAAILAIEPALTRPGLDDPRFPRIPVRIMWGDGLPPTAASLSLKDVDQARGIAAIRSEVTVDYLPANGITGNGHMLMMEDNNADLAARAMDWFRSLNLS